MSRLPARAWQPAVVLAAFVTVASQSVAQAAEQSVKSALTGIVLPAGSRLDRGSLTRMAARLLMTDEAKKTSLVIGTFEVFKLPRPSSADVAAPFVEHLRAQDGETTIVSAKSVGMDRERGATRHGLLHHRPA